MSSTKTIVNIKDESFDLSQESIRACHLSIQFGLSGFSFTILNVSRNKFLYLKSFSFLKAKTVDEAVYEMEKVFLDEQILHQPFKTINIAYCGKKSVLVPLPLFEKDKAKDYLRYNAEISEQESVFFDILKNIEAVNIYAFDAVFESWIKSNFPTAKIVHHATCLIESLLSNNKNTLTEATLFVNVGEFNFEVVLLDKKDLIFYNSFDYQSSEDFVYFLLFVCEQLKLNPENLKLKLIGEIEKNSALYSIICKYIRDVSFVDRNDMFEFSYGFYEIPDHFYFTLFNQSLIH